MDGDNHKKALQKCRAFLVQNLTFEDDILWDLLQAEDVISNIQAENIRARSLSNSRQASAFLDHMLRRPYSDYVKFKKVLRDCLQGHCADELEKVEGATPVQVSSFQPLPSRVPQPFGSDAQGTGIIAASTNLSALQLQAPSPAPAGKIMALKKQLNNVTSPQEAKKSTLEQYGRITKEFNCYPICHTTRGRGLVVTMTGNRDGWDKDVLQVATMFKYLDVLAEFKFDLKEKELTKELEEFACSEQNALVDVLFVVIMGHGGQWNNKEYLLTSDSQACYLRDILPTIFSNRINPILIDKPKVFLFQMCRGGTIDTGTQVDDSKKGKTEQDATNPDLRSIPNFSDYIIGYASQPGKTASRDTIKGTWYIQELTKEVMNNAYHRHFLDMLVEVNRNLEHRGAKEDRAQVSEPAVGLKRALYLFPGVDPTKSDEQK